MELNIENLDSMIKYWRHEKENAIDDKNELIASCYVDAFQTVRVNHGLPLLPKDEKTKGE